MEDLTRYDTKKHETTRSDKNIFSGNILAVAAHPDDLEFGAFGTLLKYCKDTSLSVYVASLGGENDPTSGKGRKKECMDALAYLSPHGIVFREKIGVDAYQEIVQEIEELTERRKFSLVLIPSHRDSHQDHRKVSRMSMSALRRSNANILFYSLLSNSLEFKPRLFVDITEYFDVKLKALKCHKSQLNKNYMSKEYLKIFHSDSFAALHGVQCVERFEINRIFL